MDGVGIFALLCTDVVSCREANAMLALASGAIYTTVMKTAECSLARWNGRHFTVIYSRSLEQWPLTSLESEVQLLFR